MIWPRITGCRCRRRPKTVTAFLAAEGGEGASHREIASDEEKISERALGSGPATPPRVAATSGAAVRSERNAVGAASPRQPRGIYGSSALLVPPLERII
jgi:hypothetical protein